MYKMMNIRFFNSFFGFFIVLLLGAVSLSAQPLADGQHIDTLIEELEERFAPDSRDVYFKASTLDDGTRLIETSSSKIPAYIKTLEHVGGKLKVKLLPDTDLKGKVQGVINLSVANLRTRGSHSAELSTQATLGTPVDVLKKQGGFYLVRTPDGYLAWVDSYGLTLKDATEMQAWQDASKVIYMQDYGHAWNTPEKGTRVSDLVMGDILRAGKREGDMQEVIFPDGRSGYVQATSVLDFNQWLKQTQPTANHVIDVAKTMMGVPYLWGGTSIKGVDCSGFTKTAYYMNGLILPRDASQQARAGIPVDIMTGDDLNVQKAVQHLKKGDLIFFSGSKYTNPRKPVTHVAIYMGEGEFIHSAGRVRINSFDPDAWNYDDQSETIVSARRFLGNQGDAALPSVHTYNPI